MLYFRLFENLRKKEKEKTIEMLYFEHFETVWKNLGCYIFNTLKQSGEKTIEMLYFFTL